MMMIFDSHRLWAGKNIHYALSRLRMGLYLRFLRSLRSRLFHESASRMGVHLRHYAPQVFSLVAMRTGGYPIFFLALGS